MPRIRPQAAQREASKSTIVQCCPWLGLWIYKNKFRRRWRREIKTGSVWNRTKPNSIDAKICLCRRFFATKLRSKDFQKRSRRSERISLELEFGIKSDVLIGSSWENLLYDEFESKRFLTWTFLMIISKLKLLLHFFRPLPRSFYCQTKQPHLHRGHVQWIKHLPVTQVAWVWS